MENQWLSILALFIINLVTFSEINLPLMRSFTLIRSENPNKGKIKKYLSGQKITLRTTNGRHTDQPMSLGIPALEKRQL